MWPSSVDSSAKIKPQKFCQNSARADIQQRGNFPAESLTVPNFFPVSGISIFPGNGNPCDSAPLLRFDGQKNIPHFWDSTRYSCPLKKSEYRDDDLLLFFPDAHCLVDGDKL